jgi:uroporphyrinogen-III decarboxylase
MAYMIEGGGSKTYSKAKTWLYKYPKESHELLQRITDVIVRFLIGQVRAGAQVFFSFNNGSFYRFLNLTVVNFLKICSMSFPYLILTRL